jgi:hypothetical protein
MMTKTGPWDGSKCATQAALDCARGEDCASGLPEDIGAPTFMRIDLAKKAVIGPQTTTEILLQDKSGKQLLLQGRVRLRLDHLGQAANSP